MPSIFLDKAVKPNDAMLARALGRSFSYWEDIKISLQKEHGALTEEWKFYGASSGWTLKLLRKKRNLFFFAPCENYFRIAFVFGDKAVHEAEASTLPPAMIRELTSAKRYAEGRGLRVDVKKKSDIKNIMTLTAIKVNN